MANTARKAANNKKNTKGKKSTTKKAPAKKSTTKKTAANSKAKKEAGIKVAGEIRVIVAFAFMVLFTLSNFGVCGLVGDGISGVFFGLFGVIQYVLPLALFVGITLMMVNDYSRLSIRKFLAGMGILLVIGAFAQLIYETDISSVHKLFEMCMEEYAGGGVICGGLALLLHKGIRTIGAVIILLALLFLFLVILTQKSFAGFFRSSAKSAKVHVEENQVKLAQIREQRKLEGRAAKKRRASRVEEKVNEIRNAENKGEGKRYVNPGSDPAASPTFTEDHRVNIKDGMKELKPEFFPKLASDVEPKKDQKELEFVSFDFRKNEDHTDEYAKRLEENRRSREESINNEERVSPYVSIGENGLYELKATEMPEEEEQGFDFDTLTIGDVTGENEVAAIEAEDVEEITVTEEDLFVPDDEMTVEAESDESVEKENKVATKNVVSGRKIRQAKQDEYIFPPITLLEKGALANDAVMNDYRQKTAAKLKATLESFGVNVTITGISCGPTVTRYEMIPEVGTRVSKIVSLTNDIKMNLSATDIRIEAPIPGKNAIGIEIPNKHNEKVLLRNLIETGEFRNFKSKLAFAVGKDIAGDNVIFDLAKMPHLLIAGATGSGKSVCINTLIMSILYKATPDEVKLIMIDPKMVELSVYNGIPHLMIPVVTDAKKASAALNWAVAEMTNRYKTFTQCHVRNIDGYNKKVKEVKAQPDTDEEKLEFMPQIVVIIDELADLMMVAPGEVEDAIVRLSQLARAAGIHLVIATQRPSVNVITGLIKANVPSRIAFSVSSGVDSRTIIDMNGAEKLLGKGDMLFYPSGYQKPVRVQGALVEDSEVGEVVDFIKGNESVEVQEIKEKEIKKIETQMMNTQSSMEQEDGFVEAAKLVVKGDTATCGMLQRELRIGFNKAARIMNALSDAGIVSQGEGTKARKVLMSEEELEQYFEDYL